MGDVKEIERIADLFELKDYDKIKIKGREGIVKIKENDKIDFCILIKYKYSIKEINYEFLTANIPCGKVIIYDKGTEGYNNHIKFLENKK